MVESVLLNPALIELQNNMCVAQDWSNFSSVIYSSAPLSPKSIKNTSMSYTVELADTHMLAWGLIYKRVSRIHT